VDLKEFKKIEITHFSDINQINYVNGEVDQLIHLDDSAMKVFRDFKEHKALTVRADVNIRDVKAKMIDNHKDFILVTNSDDKIIGTIALHYIEGQALQERARSLSVKPIDLSANDAKISLAHVNFTSYNYVKETKIGHILNTLVNYDRHHMVVYDKDESGEKYIRGYFSLPFIRRKLGLELTHADYRMNTLKKDL